MDGQLFAETFLYKPRDQIFFKSNHHKCLSYLFPLHLNTYIYVMGLRPLQNVALQVREQTTDVRF